MSEPKSGRGALAAGGLAAILALACCLGPLILVLLGFSGAWIANLTALEPWRPWFSLATLACLGWAFWTMYGPNSRCRSDGACVDPRILRRRRIWLWVATVVIVLLLLFPYYVSWFL